jgi:hypothetical protein
MAVGTYLPSVLEDLRGKGLPVPLAFPEDANDQPKRTDWTYFIRSGCVSTHFVGECGELRPILVPENRQC